MADEKDNIKNEFRSAAEETAAVFGNTLASISAEYARKLREEADTIDDLGKSLLRSFKNDLASLGRSSSALLDIQTKLLNGSLRQQDISKAIQSIDLKINKIKNDRNQLEIEFGKLTKKQQEDYQRALGIAQEQKRAIIEQGQEIDKINKKLGITGNILNIAGGLFKKLVGTNPFEDLVSSAAAARAQIKLNNEELEDIAKNSHRITAEDVIRTEELRDQNKDLQSQTTVRGQISKKIKESLTTTNLLIVAGAAILKNFLELNKAQVEFQRNIGVSVDRINTLNTSLITSIDYIQQANSLVEQFGFNANIAFSQINIQEAAELTQLMGLSAEEANNLAMFSQANGESLKENAAQAYKNISPLLSQRKVLQEIANVSPSIAMSFGGSAEALATAASNARLLGLNLSQVDKIAESLLDIENSIASEFEAEVITGKQLNLERARFFALTNDIDGVTREIAANQEVLNTFATGTRIEQQAIAESLNLSRDEVSKMIFDQQILNGLSAEEAARRSGMSIEDAKRLTIQESINKSIAKMTEALALPLDYMASLVSNAGVLYTTMAAIGTIMTVSFAKSLGSSLISLAAMIPRTATLLGLEVGVAAARMASASALTLGLGTIGVLAATALGVAGITTLIKKAQQIQDGIAPASKGPFTITDSFGATAITAKGDGLAVSPNIQREGRNTPTSVVLSDAQIQKIANAVRDGASKATINLDGNKVSSRLQTPMVLNNLPPV